MWPWQLWRSESLVLALVWPHWCVVLVLLLLLLLLQYFNPTKMNKKADLKQKEEQLRAMQERHGVDGEQHAKEK